jgi:hypothetical protein
VALFGVMEEAWMGTGINALLGLFDFPMRAYFFSYERLYFFAFDAFVIVDIGIWEGRIVGQVDMIRRQMMNERIRIFLS